MKTLTSRAARAMAAKRKTFAGGRPPVLRPCPRCGQEFGVNALRLHLPLCKRSGEKGNSHDDTK